MINLKPKPIDLFNLALFSVDKKNRFERIAKGNGNITIACNTEGGRKNINKKKSDLYISTRSPSQWQLSGSCLPLLHPVVYISANAPLWHTNKVKYIGKLKISCHNCQITNRTQFDWVRTESCSCNSIVKNSEEKGTSFTNN